MEIVRIHPFDMYLKYEKLTPDEMLKQAKLNPTWETAGTLEVDGVLYIQDTHVSPSPEASQRLE